VLKVGREGGAEVAASGAADASLLLLTMNWSIYAYKQI
jgi:hypothetical protein